MGKTKFLMRAIGGVLILMAFAGGIQASGHQVGDADTRRVARIRDGEYPLITTETTIKDLLEHPAFKGFGRHLLARDGDLAMGDLRLRDVRSLMPYHGFVNPETTVRSLNHMSVEAKNGKRIFYEFYNEQQKEEDPTKKSTGLFFYRGNPGAPFAVICPGGGFSYVGSLHEGFPYAMELGKTGLNAFVLRYRVGRGGLSAAEDLAAAVSFIFANAESLGVDRRNYSLWGSSAGARIAASVGSDGVAAFGGDNLPQPAVVVMAYTGHSAFRRSDPPMFVIVSENDRIVDVSVVERRVSQMKRAGIDVEYRKYKIAGHGFGLGVGTDAEGWMSDAIEFWRKHISN